MKAADWHTRWGLRSTLPCNRHWQHLPDWLLVSMVNGRSYHGCRRRYISTMTLLSYRHLSIPLFIWVIRVKGVGETQGSPNRSGGGGGRRGGEVRGGGWRWSKTVWGGRRGGGLWELFFWAVRSLRPHCMTSLHIHFLPSLCLLLFSTLHR